MPRLFLSIVVALLSAGAASAANLVTVTVRDTAFEARFDDGRRLRSPDLVGSELSLVTTEGPMVVRIDAVERDVAAPVGDVWLHRLMMKTPDGWREVCEPGPDGRRLGFPLVGRAGLDGLFHAAPDGAFDLVCTSGARGKCVRYGYPPWAGEHGLARYNACVRMIRADYAGSGAPTTRDGVLIDIYDDREPSTVSGPDDPRFEAGWTPAGAVCVRHVRVAENTSLAALGAQVPRLRGRLGAPCTEARARKLGAILFNRSSP